MKEKRNLFKSDNSFGIRNRQASPTPEQQAERTKSCQNSVNIETNTNSNILHNQSSIKQNIYPILNEPHCCHRTHEEEEEDVHRGTHRRRRVIWIWLWP